MNTRSFDRYGDGDKKKKSKPDRDGDEIEIINGDSDEESKIRSKSDPLASHPWIKLMVWLLKCTKTDSAKSMI